MSQIKYDTGHIKALAQKIAECGNDLKAEAAGQPEASRNEMPAAAMIIEAMVLLDGLSSKYGSLLTEGSNQIGKIMDNFEKAEQANSGA